MRQIPRSEWVPGFAESLAAQRAEGERLRAQTSDERRAEMARRRAETRAMNEDEHGGCPMERRARAGAM